MIDLTKTQQEMLVAIGSTAQPSSGTSHAAMNPLCLTGEDVAFRATGASRDDLFPLLEIVLTQRFARVPRGILIRDLLGPLKNALGNAYKHGNKRDRKKHIIIDGNLTHRGACLAITDEGPGFDVRATLDRFHEDDHYYNNHGVGFRNFSRAASTLSYANDGRTLLLCFVVQNQRDLGHPGPGDTANPLERTGGLLEKLRALLQRDRVGAIDPKDAIEIFGPRPGEPGSFRCVLTTAQGGFVAAYTLQAFSSVDAARAEYTAAHVMHESITRRKIQVPRPVALLEEPPLVVYDFAPSMNLWTYLADRGNAKAIEKMSRRLGIVLGKHHGTPLQVPIEAWTETLERWARALERAYRCMLLLDAAAAARLQSLRTTLMERAERARQAAGTSRSSQSDEESFDTVVHGSLGWDCIHYGVDGRFYLSRFQHCRKAHPGLDLGGFLADLLTDCDRTGELATYRRGEAALLEGYGEERTVPRIEELPLFVAGTLVERIAALTSWRVPGAAPMPDWASNLDPARLLALCGRLLVDKPNE